MPPPPQSVADRIAHLSINNPQNKSAVTTPTASQSPSFLSLLHNQSGASNLKSAVTQNGGTSLVGQPLTAGGPPLPKKTVPPYQEYKFGFEEAMPELQPSAPVSVQVTVADSKSVAKESSHDGLNMLLGIQKRKKNATRRMEQILKIHSVKNTDNQQVN